MAKRSTTAQVVAGLAAADASKKPPQTEFVWQVYADATLAGAAKLIPIPFVDLAIEELFRRRMPRDIAWYNGRQLSQGILSQVNRRRTSNPLVGCLLLPFRAVVYLFRDLLRTLLYAWTVADAAENVGYYWHRAFLINYAIQQGHFNDANAAALSVSAMDRTLAEVTTSPILQLAQQVIVNWKRQLTMITTYIRFARNKSESVTVVEAKDTMLTAWGSYRDYWLEVAQHYNEAFESAVVYEQVKLRQATESVRSAE